MNYEYDFFKNEVGNYFEYKPHLIFPFEFWAKNVRPMHV
jgi:hypothetical protein